LQTKGKLILELVIAYAVLLLIVAVTPAWVAYGNSTPVKMLLTLLPYLLMVGWVCLLIAVTRRPMATVLGLSQKSLGRQVGVGLVFFVLFSVAFIGLPLLLGVERTQLLSFKARTVGILIFYGVYDLFFVGLGEELIFRGYFYDRFRELTGSGGWAVLLSAISFGLFHFPLHHDWLQVGMTTILGLIFGLIHWRVRGGSTLATGITHGLYDSLIQVLSYFLL
jgi:membrane protease YdiL (CAAX protease family)